MHYLFAFLILGVGRLREEFIYVDTRDNMFFNNMGPLSIVLNVTVQNTTACAQLSLIQLEDLFKSRLSVIYLDVVHKCNRCHYTPCNLSHVFFMSRNAYLLGMDILKLCPQYLSSICTHVH